MNIRKISRRSLLSLSLLAGGALLLILFSFFGFRRQEHPDDPVFLLRINEVCTVNPGTAAGESYTFEDYIELYNPSPKDISLAHLYLSDTRGNYDLGALPEDTIPSKGYYVIYAGGEEGAAPEGFHSLPFRLSEDEILTLSYGTESRNGSQRFFPIDSFSIPALQPGAVYARTEDGSGKPAQMRPSPGESNQTSTLFLDAPSFSAKSGFYSDPFTLELQAPKGLSVYYTLDGSEPTPEDLLYQEALTFSDPSPNPNVFSTREDITTETSDYTAPKEPIDKALVVRAAAYDEAGNYSSTVTGVYFLGFDEKEGYDGVPVLSLVTDPPHLFDEETGIYVRGRRYDEALSNIEISPDMIWADLMDYLNYYLGGSLTERPTHISYFNEEQELALEQEGGLRIRGNESRRYGQKSFTLFARSRYGADRFAPVIFDNDISYPDLVLSSGRLLKKVFFFSLVEDRSTAVQDYVPCQVFLNGEYWGMYYLMEKYSATYLEGHYGIGEENSLLIKATREVQDGNLEDISRFKALREYLKLDMSDPELYADLLTQMDMQSFIDWMCTNIYIGNTDSRPLGGNVFTWQAVHPSWLKYGDGRWRWMLYDLDNSFGYGINQEGPSYEIDSFVDFPWFYGSGLLDDEPMTDLMVNENFRRQFVLTFMDMANENFAPAHVLPLLDDLEERYSAAAQKSFDRWNDTPLDMPFDEQVEEMRDFFRNRYDAIVPCLAEHFSLEGELVPVTVSAEAGEGGTVALNTLTLELSKKDWTGSYYTDYPLALTAKSREGYTFLGWEVSGCRVLSSSLQEADLEVQLENGTQPSIKAVFEKEL